jgi:hypothetical protein
MMKVVSAAPRVALALLRPPVLRKFIGGRISVGSRGMAHKAIFMVQSAQNRRRDHLSVSGEAMTGGHDVVAFGRRIWNARFQAGVWATPVIVGHPFAKDPSEMFLVERDQPIQTLRRIVPISRSQNALACGVRRAVVSTCRPIDAIARSTVAA